MLSYHIKTSTKSSHLRSSNTQMFDIFAVNMTPSSMNWLTVSAPIPVQIYCVTLACYTRSIWPNRWLCSVQIRDDTKIENTERTGDTIDKPCVPVKRQYVTVSGNYSYICTEICLFEEMKCESVFVCERSELTWLALLVCVSSALPIGRRSRESWLTMLVLSDHGFWVSAESKIAPFVVTLHFITTELSHSFGFE